MYPPADDGSVFMADVCASSYAEWHCPNANGSNEWHECAFHAADVLHAPGSNGCCVRLPALRLEAPTPGVGLWQSPTPAEREQGERLSFECYKCLKASERSQDRVQHCVFTKIDQHAT